MRGNERPARQRIFLDKRYDFPVLLRVAMWREIDSFDGNVA
jgi:hypothetical protein